MSDHRSVTVRPERGTRRLRPHPGYLGPWHPDGLQLVDTKIWDLGPTAGTVGFPAGASASAGFVPQRLGLSILGISFLYLLAGLFSGACTWHLTPRRGAVPEQTDRLAMESPGPDDGSQS